MGMEGHQVILLLSQPENHIPIAPEHPNQSHGSGSFLSLLKQDKSEVLY